MISFLFITILESTNVALTLRDIAPPMEQLPDSSRSFNLLFLSLGLGIFVVFVGFVFWLKNRAKLEKTPLELVFQELAVLPLEPLQKTTALSGISRTLLGIEHKKDLQSWTLQQLLPLLAEEDETRSFLLSADAFRFSNQIPETFPEAFEKQVWLVAETMREKEALCD